MTFRGGFKQKTHIMPIFLSILRPVRVMNPCRVQMTSRAFVGATAVNAGCSTCPPDMESSRGIEFASFPPSRRSTIAASIGILRLHVVSIRAVSAPLAVVSGTAQDAGGVIHFC